jgi:hypothetical protein
MKKVNLLLLTFLLSISSVKFDYSQGNESIQEIKANACLGNLSKIKDYGSKANEIRESIQNKLGTFLSSDDLVVSVLYKSCSHEIRNLLPLFLPKTLIPENIKVNDSIQFTLTNDTQVTLVVTGIFKLQFNTHIAKSNKAQPLKKEEITQG